MRHRALAVMFRMLRNGDYLRTAQISTSPATAEPIPTMRRMLSGVASALFIARRIQAGLAANRMPSSTNRIPNPMRKSPNAMDSSDGSLPLDTCCFWSAAKRHPHRRQVLMFRS